MPEWWDYWWDFAPFGAIKFGEREIRFFFAHRVGIDSKSQRGVGMPELIGHPPY
jgi:hypothetical protein